VKKAEGVKTNGRGRRRYVLGCGIIRQYGVSVLLWLSGGGGGGLGGGGSWRRDSTTVKYRLCQYQRPSRNEGLTDASYGMVIIISLSKIK